MSRRRKRAHANHVRMAPTKELRALSPAELATLPTLAPNLAEIDQEWTRLLQAAS